MTLLRTVQLDRRPELSPTVPQVIISRERCDGLERWGNAGWWPHCRRQLPARIQSSDSGTTDSDGVAYLVLNLSDSQGVDFEFKGPNVEARHTLVRPPEDSTDFTLLYKVNSAGAIRLSEIEY